jgi:uncharacterized membrane protein YbaN (DUF454 family)
MMWHGRCKEEITTRRHMFKNLKRNWIRLWDARPGRRFQNYYRRKHRDKRSNDVGLRVARLLMAMIFFAVAVCLFVFPLVYVPFFIMSAAMLASESPRFARILDHGEAWTRENWERTRQRWGLSQRTVNVATWAFGLGCLFLTGCVYYNRFLR